MATTRKPRPRIAVLDKVPPPPAPPAIEERPHWTVDRKVPLALIFAIAIQTAGALWWASQMTSTVDTLKTAVASLSQSPERLVRLETKVEGIGAQLTEIKGSIAQLVRSPAVTITTPKGRRGQED